MYKKLKILSFVLAISVCLLGCEKVQQVVRKKM